MRSFLTSAPPAMGKAGAPGGATQLCYSLQCNGVLAVPRLAISNQITSFSAGLESALGLCAGDGTVIPTVKGGYQHQNTNPGGAPLHKGFFVTRFSWKVSGLMWTLRHAQKRRNTDLGNPGSPNPSVIRQRVNRASGLEVSSRCRRMKCEVRLVARSALSCLHNAMRFENRFSLLSATQTEFLDEVIM